MSVGTRRASNCTPRGKKKSIKIIKIQDWQCRASSAYTVNILLLENKHPLNNDVSSW